jgi:hypothetical protein
MDCRHHGLTTHVTLARCRHHSGSMIKAPFLSARNGPTATNVAILPADGESGHQHERGLKNSARLEDRGWGRRSAERSVVTDVGPQPLGDRLAPRVGVRG